MAKWIGALDLGSCVRNGEGSNPGVPNHLVWDWGRFGDSVSLVRVDPALNGYFEKSGEVKQEGFAKAQDAWPPLDFLAEGPKNGGQHHRNVQCCILYLVFYPFYTFFAIVQWLLSF